MRTEHCTDPAIDYGTRAEIVVLASAAYVCITETKPPASQDVRLPGGKGAITALQQVIDENDAEIEALQKRNERNRRALTMLQRGAGVPRMDNVEARVAALPQPAPDYSRPVRLDNAGKCRHVNLRLTLDRAGGTFTCTDCGAKETGA